MCIFINGDERQAFYPASYLSQIAEDLQKRKKWHTAESLSEELQVPIEKINEVIVYIFIKGWQAGYAIRF
ncbi:MAG: hypothetical protein H6767_03585 [Candidatus Peribacteria bacterium]|nr:MAG: hypothetical protein H6767_03585 [Candidatus Peribacteria bacterium]